MAPVKFDDSGFRELERRLKKLEGTKRVPVTEILPVSFMKAHTQYESFEDMLAAAGIAPEDITGPEFLAENEKWNRFVQENTAFGSWSEMLKAAGINYVKRELGF